MHIKPCRLSNGFFCLVAGVCLIILAPRAGLAQSFDFRAAFPDLPANSEPSPVASKGFSIQGPGIVVIWTWHTPLLEVDNTYNSGGIFFHGRSPDSPFDRTLCSKFYQDGRETPGDKLVVGKDLLKVWAAELGNKTYTNTWEVHPSVQRELGGAVRWQNRWIVRIQMAVYPPGTNIDHVCAFKPKPPDEPEKPEIIGYPKIKEFKGDYRYSARDDGIVLIRNTDGARAMVPVRTAKNAAARFRHVLANDAGLARQLGEALSGDVPVFDGALYVQVFRGGALIHETGSGVIWISRHKQREAKRSPSIADTSWIVNGHPVPWYFSTGGRVESKNLWTGTWAETSDGVLVTIAVQGIKDVFLVKLAPDGKTFTAYKDGRVYRTGVRQR